jgi:hypothetical protein
MPETIDTTAIEKELRARGAEADAGETGNSVIDSPPASTPTSSPAATSESQSSQAPADVPRKEPSSPSAEPNNADYLEAADSFARLGEAGLADFARRQAGAAQAAAAHNRGESAQNPWWECVRREVESSPDLRDVRSDLHQALQAVLRETPLYALAPDGFRQAAALARARQTASTVPALQAKLDALSRENERLIKLTSVTGSGPAKVSTENNGDLNERDLRRLAAELDSI